MPRIGWILLRKIRLSSYDEHLPRYLQYIDRCWTQGSKTSGSMYIQHQPSIESKAQKIKLCMPKSFKTCYIVGLEEDYKRWQKVVEHYTDGYMVDCMEGNK